MAEVSFYILSSYSTQERHLFACKLIEKAFRCGQFCYVQTDSLQQSQQIDNQLWTFRPSSFVPHQLYDGHIPEYQKTVLIGTLPAPEQWQAVIINLSLQFPEDLTRTQRVLEILDNNEQVKQAGRQRYRQYQKAGLEITMHNM